MNKNVNEIIIELRLEDKNFNEIAKELNITRDKVVYHCRKHGLSGIVKSESLQNREIKFVEEFESVFPEFKYCNGFKNVDAFINIKCKKCGTIQSRLANVVRLNKFGRQQTIICNYCDEQTRIEKNKWIELEEKTNLRSRLIDLIKLRKEEIFRDESLNKLCKRCNVSYRANSLSSVHCDDCLYELKQRPEWKDKMINCNECGIEFEMSTLRSKYCSRLCSKKAGHRNREVNRNKRLIQNGYVDNTISLSKLQTKDNNICGICGKRCDDKDYQYTDEGHFIAGNYYPSIDHVLPVNKGGTHTWDNVQLAHRYCNSMKSDSLYKTIKANGQLRFV